MRRIKNPHNIRNSKIKTMFLHSQCPFSSMFVWKVHLLICWFVAWKVHLLICWFARHLTRCPVPRVTTWLLPFYDEWSSATWMLIAPGTHQSAKHLWALRLSTVSKSMCKILSLVFNRLCEIWGKRYHLMSLSQAIYNNLHRYSFSQWSI